MRTIYKSDSAVILTNFPTPEEAGKRFGKGSTVQTLWSKYLEKEFRPYTPFVTGELQRSALRASDFPNGLIIYDPQDAPKAKRLYWNPQFKFTTTHNPLAGAFWDRRAAMARQTNFWEPYLKSLIARNLGGK